MQTLVCLSVGGVKHVLLRPLNVSLLPQLPASSLVMKAALLDEKQQKFSCPPVFDLHEGPAPSLPLPLHRLMPGGALSLSAVGHTCWGVGGCERVS